VNCSYSYIFKDYGVAQQVRCNCGYKNNFLILEYPFYQ